MAVKGETRVYDLETGHYERFQAGQGWVICRGFPEGWNGIARESHGDQVMDIAWSVEKQLLATAGKDGVVRFGPIGDKNPHLMLGHEGEVLWVSSFSPDGRWVLSSGQDGTIRLWPVPDGEPVHLLPYDELLGYLKALTNVRVFPDEENPSGYRIDHEEFPGWETVPTW